jgi:GntR family transcriptional regulator, galactonate operon transcriptional repressor
MDSSVAGVFLSPLQPFFHGDRARRRAADDARGKSAVADATEPMRRRTTKRAAGTRREEIADRAISVKRNVNDSLAAALGCEIIAGLYPPGSRLPTEATLLVRFGVSRPTLREAFRALEAKGLIVSRQKVGTMVRPKAEWHMLDADFLAWHMKAAPTEVFVSDVLQLRRIFEPQAAALAAEARDAAALGRIEAAYADMEAHKSGDAELIAADVRFHKEILQASGNRLLGALGSLIEMALVGTFKMGWRSLAIKDDRLHQHRDVMQAIAARRPEAARAAMAKLLQESGEDVRRALALDRAAIPSHA